MPKKFMLMLLMGLLLILMVMGGGFFMLWKKTGAPQAETQVISQEVLEEEKVETLGSIFPLDTFIVNLADSNANRFLRVTMALELSDGAVNEEIEKRVPQIRDSILMILPTKSVEDIRTTAGKTTLREEIVNTLNGLLATGEIKRLFFKEFIIQ